MGSLTGRFYFGDQPFGKIILSVENVLNHFAHPEVVPLQVMPAGAQKFPRNFINEGG